MDLSIQTTQREKLKHLLIAFTAGNLCFIRRWYDLERLEGYGLDYYRTAPQSPNLLIGTLLCAFLLACVFYFGWRWSNAGKPWRRRVGFAIFATLLAYPLESIRRYWNTETPKYDIPMNVVLLLLVFLLLTGGAMALWGRFRISIAAEHSLVWISLLLPALIFNFSGDLIGREQADAFQKQAPLPMFPARPAGSPKAIWVIFDEFDQNLAFRVRPDTLQMPEFDRLRQESVVAEHAQQTANWTVIAIPSLLSGRIFGRAEMINARTLRVFPEGTKEALNWRDQPNVFKTARQAGINAEIIGWHHPYCRILGDQVVSCFAMPSGHPTAALLRETHAAEEGVWGTTGYLLRLQVENLKDLFRSDNDAQSEKLKDLYLQSRQQNQYFEIRDRAYRAAVDPRIGLLVLHLPLPHPYAYYNRRERSFKLDGTLDYFDALALADRTIGELRGALEQARMWDSTTLLITSDHGIRPDAWEGRYGWTEELERLTGGKHGNEVPFLLKLAGNQPPMKFTQPFSNVVSSSLVMDILESKVHTSQQAVEWLDHAAPTSSATVTQSASSHPR